MDYILKNAQILTDGHLRPTDITIQSGRIASLTANPGLTPTAAILDVDKAVIFPGFVDVHVHLREPGFSYKETICTGTRSAARGGYAHIHSMPNLNPVPDTLEHLREQLSIIDRDALIHVHPYGSITQSEQGEKLSEMAAMSPYTAGFSDDGRGVQSAEIMRSAMLEAKRLGKIIAAHCEDNTLLHGGYIHAGQYAKTNGHRGISSESEWSQIARDLALAEETGCKYHVCHISTKESVDLIRAAKTRGVDVTCETGPHYLIFSDADLREDGRYKMNPPLRSAADKQALIDGLIDGTIDMIATDHAPHSAEEKSGGLERSLMGVVGLETAFAAMYTYFVKPGIITLARLVELMHDNPARRFGFGTPLAAGQPADLTVFNLDEEYTVDPERFRSKGRATPFAGARLCSTCKLTMIKGEIVWKEGAA